MEDEQKKVKFGLRFRDGYRIEMDANPNHQLVPVYIYVDTDSQLNRYMIWDGNDYNQLYGQMMTLVEAIIGNPTQLEAAKSLLKKELNHFEDVLQSKAVPLSDQIK